MTLDSSADVLTELLEESDRNGLMQIGCYELGAILLISTERRVVRIER